MPFGIYSQYNQYTVFLKTYSNELIYFQYSRAKKDMQVNNLAWNFGDIPILWQGNFFTSPVSGMILQVN
jgi:hypothetical protein